MRQANNCHLSVTSCGSQNDKRAAINDSCSEVRQQALSPLSLRPHSVRGCKVGGGGKKEEGVPRERLCLTRGLFLITSLCSSSSPPCLLLAVAEREPNITTYCQQHQLTLASSCSTSGSALPVPPAAIATRCCHRSAAASLPCLWGWMPGKQRRMFREDKRYTGLRSRLYDYKRFLDYLRHLDYRFSLSFSRDFSLILQCRHSPLTISLRTQTIMYSYICFVHNFNPHSKQPTTQHSS